MFDLDIQVKEVNQVQPDSVVNSLICTIFCSATCYSGCC
nr:FDLD family class I lanthipeptide [Brevibacillus laterosporus]